MQDFILTLLFNIQGIGATSGLVYDNNKILLISDNSNGLYTYDMTPSLLGRMSVAAPGIAENIPKKEKPDYEALAMADGKIYLFGSGSTDKRNFATVANYPEMTHMSVYNLSNLYDRMRNVSRISADDFNIEGATKYDGKWYFFQRGNGPQKMNGVFTVRGNITTGNDQTIAYNPVPLPDCNGIPATFTDAVTIDGKIYFTATAENSNSIYHDGEILGSMVGCLNPETMEIIFTKVISQTHKFEGLALFEKKPSEISFLLCEDSDSDALQSGIYKLVLPL